MKKFVLILIAAICLCSCTEPKKKLTVSTSSSDAIFDEIIEFEHKGHQWIWFKNYEGPYLGYAGGIVHDPDCWCGAGNNTWGLEEDIDYD